LANVVQTARQAIVGLQLQLMSAGLMKLLAEGSSKVTETGIEPAIPITRLTPYPLGPRAITLDKNNKFGRT